MLEGKVILITGSSRGIGAATAKLAKEYGAKVILHGKTESEQLKSLAKTLDSEYIVCDVTDEKQGKEAVGKLLQKIGRLDVLVNCAGGIKRGQAFLELTKRDWEEMLEVNLLGTFYFCQAVVPVMQERKYGKIVNVSSIRGLNMGRPTSIPYAASKAAVVNFTQTLAKDLAPYINVNSVAPGSVATEGSKEWPKDLIAEFIEKSLMKQLTPPESVAETILFLASDRAKFITGQTIIVDGGYSISGK